MKECLRPRMMTLDNGKRAYLPEWRRWPHGAQAWNVQISDRNPNAYMCPECTEDLIPTGYVFMTHRTPTEVHVCEYCRTRYIVPYHEPQPAPQPDPQREAPQPSHSTKPKPSKPEPIQPEPQPEEQDIRHKYRYLIG